MNQDTPHVLTLVSVKRNKVYPFPSPFKRERMVRFTPIFLINDFSRIDFLTLILSDKELTYTKIFSPEEPEWDTNGSSVFLLVYLLPSSRYTFE